MKSKIDHMGHDDDGDAFVYQWDWNGCDGPVDDPLLGDIMSPGDTLNGAASVEKQAKLKTYSTEEEKLETEWQFLKTKL